MIRNAETLHGFSVPGLNRKIILALFADDATVFLSEHDRFDDLRKILTKWCLASGAKFNIEKTEILPIGHASHREAIYQSRKIHIEDTPLQNNIRIARDGEWIRVLGAPIGNGFQEAGPWTPTIEKIRKTIERWSRIKPTFEGKRLIVQMVVGGMTQYRTAVQGMPDAVTNELNKIIRDFVWDNKKPLISLEYLQMTKDQGGMKLLDLESRNEAIDIERLKRYLNMEPTRPTWAFILDTVINLNHPDEEHQDLRENTFLQNWTIPIQGRGWGSALPGSVTRMIKASKKYHTSIEALRVSKKIKGQLPAWYHLGNIMSKRHNPKIECLQTIHKVKSSADLLQVTHRLKRTHHPDKHSRHIRCRCTECSHDRDMGCECPWKCAEEAKKLIENIKPKWNAMTNQLEDGLTHTRRRRAENKTALENRGRICFNPTVTAKDSLNECIRIFINPDQLTGTPATRLQRTIQNRYTDEQTTHVFTDGSSIKNGSDTASCGAGVWFGEGDRRNRSIKPPTTEQTNQTGEVAAIVIALQEAPKDVPLQINSDSLTTIEGLTKHLGRWEDIGWLDVDNSELLRMAAYLLRVRCAPTYFQWVKGHAGIEGNERADRLAGQAALKQHPDNMDLEIPQEYRLTGTKLSSMTQAIAYRTIRKHKESTPRQHTEENVSSIKDEFEKYTGGVRPSTKAIWKSMGCKDIRLNIRQYLYKSAHAIHKIGSYWRYIPDCEQRSYCTTCDAYETMTHIMTQCTAEPRRIIWQLAENVWNHEKYKWPEITEEIITGCGMLTAIPKAQDPVPDQRKENKGASRLLRIIVSESAFLIWKMRNEKTINNQTHTKKTIEDRWRRTIEDRLLTDRATATRKKKDATLRNRVHATWTGTIHDENGLPEDWATNLNIQVTLKRNR